MVYIPFPLIVIIMIILELSVVLRQKVPLVGPSEENSSRMGMGRSVRFSG